MRVQPRCRATQRAGVREVIAHEALGQLRELGSNHMRAQQLTSDFILAGLSGVVERIERAD